MTDPRPVSDAASTSLWRERAIDSAIFAALFGAYLAWLLGSVHNLGYARDEGFYFHAAQTYGKWFELLLSHPSRALERNVIDQYWSENHEHPALMKSLFWASQRFLEGRLFSERGTAYRFPAMVLSSLAVATTFAWGRRALGRAGGVVAALSLAFIPSIFFHSHLACFDMPIAAMWFFTAYAYQRSLQTRGLRWPLFCAVLYGLALDTKHNAWFLPPALLLHAVFSYVLSRRQSPREPFRFPLAFLLTPIVAPAIFYAGWPWIWHETVPRLLEYAQFHLQHVYYNMEFLGRTYFEPPFPRSYAWVMTFATVPGITLLVCGIGMLSLLVRDVSRHGAWGWWRRQPAAPAATAVAPAPMGSGLLWLLGILVNYGAWLSDSTPIFGGTKHWITAYPFMALFAGQGFTWLRAALTRDNASAWLVKWGLGAALLVGPLVMTWHSHPWGLSAYTPLVGGAPGAATLGLNRTFWGYTTGALQEEINAAAPRGGRVFIHDTAVDSFRMLQRDGRIRADIKPWWTVSGSRLALYHHEQHMSLVEHMIWVDYGTVAPRYIGAFDGVPVVWLYDRTYRVASAQ